MSGRRKNRTLPPLGGSTLGSNLMNDRARMIPGSPAPTAMKPAAADVVYQPNRKTSPGSPRITLTKSPKTDPDPFYTAASVTTSNVFFQDTVVEVSSVGGKPELTRSFSNSFSKTGRPSTSLSILSAKSLADVHQSIREREHAVLAPPPRVVAVKDGQGFTRVVTELVDPGRTELPQQTTQKDLPKKYQPLQPIKKSEKRS